MPAFDFRAPLAAVLAASLVAACATPQPATPPEQTPPAPARDESASPTAPLRPTPTPKARPARSERDKAAKADKLEKTDKAGGSGENAVEDGAVASGPAWLALCNSRQSEGGVIRCDADQLLTQPSPQVKIFTREPAAVGVGKTGSIQYRAGLPHKYRFFVVP